MSALAAACNAGCCCCRGQTHAPYLTCPLCRTPLLILDEVDQLLAPQVGQ